MKDDELIADLISQLRAADAEIRCEAAGALGALGGDGATIIVPLLEACFDSDEHVRGKPPTHFGNLPVRVLGP
jgi:HEAT repeat protein